MNESDEIELPTVDESIDTLVEDILTLPYVIDIENLDHIYTPDGDIAVDLRIHISFETISKYLAGKILPPYLGDVNSTIFNKHPPNTSINTIYIDEYKTPYVITTKIETPDFENNILLPAYYNPKSKTIYIAGTSTFNNLLYQHTDLIYIGSVNGVSLEPDTLYHSVYAYLNSGNIISFSIFQEDEKPSIPLNSTTKLYELESPSSIHWMV